MNRVVIVGGGTAGWMTASYLRAAFGDRLSVTVVESPRIGTIGVGEATFSTIRHFFQYLGLSEEDWMPACDATYKLAIRFENWRRRGHYFYHPFERLRVIDGFTLADWWLKLQPSERFDQDCFLIASLCDAKKSPRYLDGTLFEDSLTATDRKPVYRTTLSEQNTQFPYAYHFDASLLARFLADYAVQRGTKRILDDVLDVQLDERGWISHLTTKEHGSVPGDLFVDCTGFRGLLINQALGEPVLSYQDALPNDRAVALRVPTDMATTGIRPCTTATAADSGWIWTIPLMHRIGTGYVYASDYCTPEKAEQTLRDFVGPEATGLTANHIRMRIGRSRRSWVKNCVAIGLTSGFVEPLESTGIFFIQHGIEQLVKHFPFHGWDRHLCDSYNRARAMCMDGVRDFLVLHYLAAGRADNDYWRDTSRRPVPDSLAEQLELWQSSLPATDTVFPHYHGFEPYSYACMLLGLGGVPTRPLPALSLLEPAAALNEFKLARAQARTLLNTLPSQYDYFAKIYDLAAG
jgi:glycine/D-amino acid oxidase-like deaminating enzyme